MASSQILTSTYVRTLFIISIVSFSGILAGVSLLFVLQPRIYIESPKLGMPIIRIPNEQLLITVKWPYYLSPQDCQIRLTNNYSSYDLTNSIFFRNQTKIVFKAQIPSQIFPGLYDLEIEKNGIKAREAHAIMIRISYPKTLRFVQISDVHIAKDDFTAISNFKEFVKEMNILNPDFVLITGDIAHTARKVEWEIFEQMLLEAQFPTYCVIGNHDVGDTNEFIERLAPIDYSFSVGLNFHFTAFNTGDKSAAMACYYPIYNWIQQDLETHKSIPIKFFACHIPIDDDDFTTSYRACNEKVVSLMTSYNVSAAFSGHNHRNEINYFNGTDTFTVPNPNPLSVQTVALGDPANKYGAGFRWIEADYQLGITKLSYDVNGDGQLEQDDSIPIYRINQTTDFKNNGQWANFSIQNQLYTNFTDCRIRLSMSKTNSSVYTTSLGQITDVYTLVNSLELIIRVDIPQNSTISGIVQPL